MTHPYATWWSRLAYDPQLLALLLVLGGGILLILLFGHALAPYLTAVVVAYLLEGVVRRLVHFRIPRPLAFAVVYSLFMVLLVYVLFVLLPNLAGQLSDLLTEMPRIMNTLKTLLDKLVESGAILVDPALTRSLLAKSLESSQDLATNAVVMLLQWIPGLLTAFLYLLLVPFLVFFFLKDKESLLAYLIRFLPRERDLVRRVFSRVEVGLGGYLRGKFWELMALTILTYWAFVLLKFQYAFLLALLTGLSVLIPFLGVAVVTLPVAILGVFQWGLTWESLNPLITYIFLQAIDGSVIAPLILGETMELHPSTIVLSVLFFGYWWGILGVFFAVPLAVLIKSVVESIHFYPTADPVPG